MDEYLKINQLWRLADTLTIIQAAALIAGYEPNAVRFGANDEIYFEDEDGASTSKGGRSVKTTFEALKNSIESGKLKVKKVHDSRPIDSSDTQSAIDACQYGEYMNVSYENIAENDEHFKNGYFIKNHVNWEKTVITADDLRT